jgi:hypothetical protein
VVRSSADTPSSDVGHSRGNEAPVLSSTKEMIRDASVSTSLTADRLEMNSSAGTPPWIPPITLELRVEAAVRWRSSADLALVKYESVRALTDVFAVRPVDAREQTLALEATSPWIGHTQPAPIEGDPLAALLEGATDERAVKERNRAESAANERDTIERDANGRDGRERDGIESSAGEHGSAERGASALDRTPGGGLRPGAEWSAPPSAIARLLALDAGIGLELPPAEPLMLGANFWRPSDWFGASATGTVRVRVRDTGARLNRSRAALRIEVDIADEHDLLLLERMRVASADVEREALRSSATVHGSGDLIWDIEHDRAVSFRLQGELHLVLRETRVIRNSSGEYRIYTDVSLSGPVEASVDVSPIDPDTEGAANTRGDPRTKERTR